jgi:hypothetical protein
MLEINIESANADIIKLARAIELDLRRYLENPADYQSEYLADTHACAEMLLSELGTTPYEEDEAMGEEE